jgi:hypothetical protein
VLHLLKVAAQLLDLHAQLIIRRHDLCQLASQINLPLFGQRQACTERPQALSDVLIALAALAFQCREIGTQRLQITLRDTTGGHASEKQTDTYEQSSHGDASSYCLRMAKWARRFFDQASSLCPGSAGSSSP